MGGGGTQPLDHRRCLAPQTYPFRAVTCFSSLFYYAFIPGAQLLTLAVQLAAFLIAGEVWTLIAEVRLRARVCMYVCVCERESVCVCAFVRVCT